MAYRNKPWLMALLAGSTFLAGCGGGGSGDSGGEFEPLFDPQMFSDGFDHGQAAARWGCDTGSCAWEVVTAGALDPFVTPAASIAGVPNYVFQSPDPLAMNLNRSSYCESFSAHFEQQGTFAFNYFVATAGPIGFDDGNALEVDLISHTIEPDPDFGEIIVDSVRTNLLREVGQVSSRFQTVLEPGYYDFVFCYDRDRTFNIGPDFVQVDNVDTCVGTTCMGEVPAVARCREHQGETLVPDSRDARGIVSVNDVVGYDDRYSVIVDTTLLEFVDSSLETLDPDPAWNGFRNGLDAVVTLMNANGASCDIDQRRYVTVVFTQEELIDFLLASEAVWDAVDKIMEAIDRYVIEPILLESYKAVFGDLWGTALFLWRDEISGAVDDIGI